MSVFFYGCVTLDGYLADKNHRLDWLHQTGTVEDTGYESFYRQMDVTLMARRKIGGSLCLLQVLNAGLFQLLHRFPAPAQAAQAIDRQ